MEGRVIWLSALGGCLTQRPVQGGGAARRGRVRHARRPGLGVAGSTLAAGPVATVVGNFFPKGALPFTQQKFFGNARLKMSPGQGAARLAFPRTFLRAQAAFFQRFQPGSKRKMLHPAGEDGTLAVGLFHHIGHAAVGAGQNAFKMAHGGFVPAQFKEFHSLELLSHKMDPPLDFFLADLGHPLKGRKGFGHKGRKGRRDLQARAAAPGGVTNLEARFGNGGQVFVRFGRQADHEIELHLTPAVLKQLLGMQQQVFFSDALVDDVAQALAASLWGQRAAGAAQIGHALDDFVVNGAHPQRRQGKADLFTGATVQRVEAQGLQG